MSRLIIQANEQARFEAETVKEMQELVALWKTELLPVLYAEPPPGHAGTAVTRRVAVTQPAAPPDAPKARAPYGAGKALAAEEKELSKRFAEKAGHRFRYDPACGQSRLEAVREAVAALEK